MATAAELRDAAARLAAEATWMPAALDRIAVASGPDVWQGPAADRFEADLLDQRRRLGVVSDQLWTLARGFVIVADDMDAGTLLARGVAEPGGQWGHVR